MKKIVFLYMVLMFNSWGVFAQQQKAVSCSGIYKTARDLKDEKLSYIVNCDSSSGKIRLNHFFSGKRVDVKQNGKEYSLSKDSVFGYRDCKGKDFRFHGGNSRDYKVEEIKGLIIYSALVNDPNYTGKGIKLVTAYFFSKDLNSDILPLTAKYLKQVFQNDTRFCNMISSLGDITSYDETHKMYTINYLLTQSTLNNKQTP
jgi:hypothetical protein